MDSIIMFIFSFWITGFFLSTNNDGAFSIIVSRWLNLVLFFRNKSSRVLLSAILLQLLLYITIIVLSVLSMIYELTIERIEFISSKIFNIFIIIYGVIIFGDLILAFLRKRK
ncbi:hypothetical protein PMSM_24735 [Paenibacillus macquariensis subsp. macquariensis]|nr:hypothetical protein PMSM_24735 [Paenibacillus macquariensis subsp. macquariensis]